MMVAGEIDLELVAVDVIEIGLGLALEMDLVMNFEETACMPRQETQLYGAKLNSQVLLVAWVLVMVIQTEQAYLSYCCMELVEGQPEELRHGEV